jgi:hypothetical protein
MPDLHQAGLPGQLRYQHLKVKMPPVPGGGRFTSDLAAEWEIEEQLTERKKLYGDDRPHILDLHGTRHLEYYLVSRGFRRVKAPAGLRYYRTENEVENLFNRFLDEWTRDTAMLSDQVSVLIHPAYYKIIGLGTQVIPLILRDLERGGGPWFVALEALTLENPVKPEHAAKAKLMRKDWLEWGRENGYLS